MLLAAFLAAVTWTVQAPSFRPGTIDACAESTVVENRLAKLALYQSERYSDGAFSFVREHATIAGQIDTFHLDDSGPGRTYLLRAMTLPAVGFPLGVPGCPLYNTVGIPSVGVALPLVFTYGDRVRWIDPSGRAMQYQGWLPLPGWPSGIYWRQVRRGREIIGRTAFVVVR